MAYARGKYAKAISDRSGMAFPYNEMVKKEKAKYGNTQQMKEGGIAKGGGIAIKGLKFKGIF